MADWGLPAKDAALLGGDGVLGAFFEECVAAGAPELAQPIANMLINDLPALLKDAEDADVRATALEPAALAKLVELVRSDAISSKQGKEVFAELVANGGDPEEIVEAKGMKQVELLAKLQLAGVDLSVPALSLLEGQKRPVSDIELNAIADILGVSVDWLLGRDN
jgi:aspartyl-tRNA(Asn)/glutamyl-tRNA(Gln) amidotransferase subunit B